MRAIVMYGPGDVRVENRPEPAIEAPTDALVRVLRTCICGSDLHPYHSMNPSADGSSMGHEMIGVVEQIGGSVSTVHKGDLGDRTLRLLRQHLRHLPRRLPDRLPARRILQHLPVRTGPRPPGRRHARRSPTTEDESVLKSYLALSDVYMTGYHAAFMDKVEPGKSVTVIGDGAVGLSSVLAASRMGAERIILMGRHTDRTGLGREFGATDVVAERGQEGVEKVREMTGGQGTHVVLEAVGHMPAYEQAYGVVRSGGVISRVGVPQHEEAPVGFMSLFGRNITLTGGPAPVRAYLEQGLADVVEGRINPGRLFDVTLPLGPQRSRADGFPRGPQGDAQAVSGVRTPAVRGLPHPFTQED